ncbi:pilin [Vibrio litoralis]|uniref:pilin n=1 Tax=Vibrio litoralis TaxID=335972 RepID=UPI00041B89CC|nr:pilin [Vibrio litoralis]
MKQLQQGKKKLQKGFTLIELMIVVAIIGVLSAIAIPAYQDYVKKGELASGLATMKALITPAELMYQSEGSLSSAVSTLGIAQDSNSLGEITIDDTNDEITFEFKNGSATGDTLVYTRDTTGWACVYKPLKTNDVELDGCPK